MSLGFALAVRVVALAVIGILYLSSGDRLSLFMFGIVAIGAAWTVYRTRRAERKD